ncbi:radical SAM protein [Pseudobutyrivibrio sp. LB2011]|uniref:radical SAM protein n=1 Tax=Pseudobutyrivibrio sp. LB2011 TaxID=1408312 RepID=UPI0005D1F85D|nr:radical SAM protein [Pseudobutyrivibrio sp. LB2011]
MNELRIKFDQISKYIPKERKVAIFGCGKLGEELYPVLIRYDLFGGFIDNDKGKQESGYLGEKVDSLEDFLKKESRPYIVITATKQNTKAIDQQLEKNGLKAEQDFTDWEHFLKHILPLISYFRNEKIFVNLAQICVTERCTLRCEACAHACNKVSREAEDMSFESIKKSADSFFKNVDIVKEFVLIGGEPFLYKDLSNAIEYIGENYREKIIMFSITTNGTITPDDAVIDLIKKYNVTVRISDYSYTLPNLKKNYEKILDKLRGIKTVVLDTSKDQWFDYGFFEVDNGQNEEVLRKIFKTCNTPCREIRENKYYYCVMARSVSENSGKTIGLDEYLDMDTVQDKEDVLAFELGLVENGYLSMCRYCRGAEAEKYLIPAAIQQR